MAMDLIGPILLIKPAFKDAQRRDLLLLLGGSLCLLPVGLALLSTISPETYRYLVSSISLVLMFCLVFGLRYSGKMYPPLCIGCWSPFRLFWWLGRRAGTSCNFVLYGQHIARACRARKHDAFFSWTF